MEDDQQDYYTPVCDEALKRAKGKSFRTIDEGVDFYKKYARVAGFDVRLSSARKVGDIYKSRCVVCSREGEKNNAIHGEDDGVELSQNRRRRVSMRCGCMARVIFKFVSEYGYVVQNFIEKHNHPLVEDQYKHFMKLNRNLDYIHQKFILDCAQANIGPTQSYKLLTEFLGGHDGVGCSVVDVRNFTRDMKAFVEGSDAQMLLNETCRKKENCEAFTFDYEVDGEDKLKWLFWCDPVSKRNYHMFGDVVAFDTTYSTNKYCMIFVPFIGKDNHGKPVTFAAGLLSKEDSSSFSWLFEKFVACMRYPPSLIITDQDLGMKVAIERVLTGTRHRWCMWHIMLKIADKVSKELHANEDFKNELNSYVWSELIEPDVFEAGWEGIMIRYGLATEAWFIQMFENRNFWVPAFFRDFRMSGLVRTISISECENSFFKRYTRYRSNLLEFLMNFDHALDAQRNSNAHMNYLDKTMIPKLATKLGYEKHAAMTYSGTIFRDVQFEIKGALFYCDVTGMCSMGNDEEFMIKDETYEIYKVVYNKDEDTLVCGCKRFGRMGLLYRHIFVVLKIKGVKCIPDKYIVGRWKKLSLVIPVHEVVDCGDEGAVAGDVHKIMIGKVMSDVFKWVGKIEGNNDKMVSFVAGINELGASIVGGDSDVSHVMEKKRLLEDFYGVLVPEKIDVLPPNVVKTKGSGSRLISRKEKAIRMLEKPLRRCVKCRKLANHDSRNCGKVSSKKQ